MEEKVVNIPNTITAVGLGVGIAGIGYYPSVLGLLLLTISLVFDAIDGYLSRKRHEETWIGKHLDWYTDVGLSHGVAWIVLPFPWAWSAFLVLLQTYCATYLYRVSGRALVTVLAIIIAL